MPHANPNARLEAFSDGIFAIATTLLVLELKVPRIDAIHSVGDLWAALFHLWPSLFAFALSFVMIFIGWANSCEGFKLIDKTSPHFVYANGFLLFTIVLLPFPTALLGEYLLTDYAQPAVILYNFVSILSSVAWVVSTRTQVSLAKNEVSRKAIVWGSRMCVGGLGVYICIAAVGIWFPLTSMAMSSALWGVWLVAGIALPPKPEGEVA